MFAFHLSRFRQDWTQPIVLVTLNLQVVEKGKLRILKFDRTVMPGEKKKMTVGLTSVCHRN